MEMKNRTITKDDLKGFNRGFLEDYTYSLMQQIEQMNRQMMLLTDQVNMLNQQKFGRHTEKTVRETPGQLELCFNETEVTLSEASPEELTEPCISDMNPLNKDVSGKKKAPHPKRTRGNMLKALPETEVPFELEEEELSCECGGRFTAIGSEVIRRLEFTPASFRVINQRVCFLSDSNPL